ncbi:MAG: Cupin domain protein [Thermocaproicibacter melissae]|jgi:quercetin dioxygenase-like cupin family protein|uniref:cupin domain-containing protein n=1 Tax=Thermocaproicibacter melissae TaxID=2966552 RepID=UPI0016B46C5A|nr:cupin domain-containing protein [Thermocaproicibacter melissae]NLG92752.1 cupin domain-containing protein [Clostridiales bacterium]WBY63362.1 cupin domain-containing protein [Thermocaproicibacter melissae]
MADKYIKNIDFAQVLPLAEQVGYQPGQIVSKTLAQNGALSLTLFAFDKGEEISTHESEGDAMVVALDGEGEITVGGEKFTVHAGETIIMPSKTPHAVYAAERFKMFLIVVFPNK